MTNEIFNLHWMGRKISKNGNFHYPFFDVNENVVEVEN